MITKLIDSIIDLALIHNLWDVTLNKVSYHFYDLSFELILSVLSSLLEHVFLCIFLKLSKCIKLTYVLCKLIIKLWKLLLLNNVKLNLECCVLASKIICAILLREFNVNVELLASLMTNDLLLKAWNELT